MSDSDANQAPDKAAVKAAAKSEKAARKAKGSVASTRAERRAVKQRDSVKSGKGAKKKKVKEIKFKYRALDDAGKTVSGTEVALSAGAAHVALLARGLQPLQVESKRSLISLEITKKKVPRQDVMNFTRQLAVFMKAGVPIMEALEVIVEETQDKILRLVLEDMVNSLRSGDTFAAAAAAHPEAFPNFYVGILESAELTGNLDLVLNQLADYIDRDIKARGKVTAALIYPAVVAAMSVVTVIVLSVFVLPRFVVFFKSLNAKLPLVTRMLLSSSSFVSKWWYVEIALILLITGSFIAMRRSEGGRGRMDQWQLRLPVIGDLTETAIIERTCRVLASMLRAGVDLPRSMAVTAESANNAVYRTALEKVREVMMQGQGLAEPIAMSGLFPAAARQMFRVGEETGTLDQQLEVAAAYYNRELETKLERATALFEPAIIILMGVVVGFVAVALISAMYGIYNQVKVS
ncbi:MAG TPA: type II secretion system F family protein [Acidimicrobiales bacterium]|nr:type II secretion system F family protein [Acidimicrobiales bacterium]